MPSHLKNPTRDFLESHPPGEAGLAPFRKARLWLSDRLLAEQRERTTVPETWCHILLGCWICDSLTGSAGTAFPPDIHAIGTALTRGGRRPQADWSKTPPTLKLIAASLFSRHRIHVDFLHADAGYLHQAQALLASLPRSRASDEVAFFDKCVLLHRMGRIGRPKPAPLTEVVRFARDLPLTDTGTGLEHLLGMISSTTELGRRSVVPGKAGAWMEKLLMGFAMGALRRYELIAGCRWMRAARYMGVGGERLGACVEFLQLHQRAEGPFGYYDTVEELPGVKIRKNSLPFFTGVSINLPVTVECLWTLAELSSPWRLFCRI